MPNSKNNTVITGRQETIDSMDKTLESLPHVMKISPHVFSNIITTLKHARMFVTSRNIMHVTGIELYDELIVNLEDLGKAERKI